jgi:hypothetical protein
MATEDLPVLLTPSDSMLPGNIWWNIPLMRYEAEALWLRFDGLKSILMGSGGFSEELDLKASFALVTFATVFQSEVYTFMACSDYCVKECITAFAQTIGPLYWR